MDNSSPMTTFFKNKWVRLFLIVDAIAIIAVVVFAVNNALKTSVLNFNVTPLDAKILVNGREYEDGSYRVMPGKYEVEISHEGMVTKTFNVELGGEDIVNIVTYLVGEDGGFEFYELRDNYGSYVELSEIASAENNVTTDKDTSAEEFVAMMEKDLAVYTSGVLPINYSRYDFEENGRKLIEDVTIRKGQSGECAKTLCIEALMLFTDDKNAIMAQLADKGFKVEDYEIIYKIY